MRLPCTTVTNITDATSFFSDVINAWTPSSDQSSLSKLNTCDLQIGMANISSTASSIDFNLTHAMSLAEVTLTTKEDCNCELYSDASYTWAGPVPASENFGTNKPFKVTDYEYTNNKFVEIVKPHTETEFSGGKNEYGVWSLSISGIEPNAIGSGSSILEKKQRFTLELGDMYYNDGALTHQSEALASTKTPIGIVAYLSDGSSNNKWVETGTTSTGYGGHALVMGLKTIGSTGTYAEAVKNYNYSNESAAAKAYRGTSCYRKTSNTTAGSQSITTASAVVGTKTTNYGSGYIQTTRLWNNGSYPAFTLTKTYNSTNPAPSKTTGWFIPTAGQWYATIYYGIGGASDCTWNVQAYFSRKGVTTHITDPINKALSKVGDGNYTICSGAIQYREWTSSEYDDIRGIMMGNGLASNNGSQYAGTIGFIRILNTEASLSGAMTPRVRPFLAF